MSRTQDTRERAVSTGVELMSDPEWTVLSHALASIESEYASLIECLQQERERVVLFDCAGLLAALSKKDTLLRNIVASRSPRQAMLVALSDRVGARTPAPGSDIAAVTRALVPHAGPYARDLEDACARLEALTDVARELQNMNRKLVRRALGWVEEHLAELIGGGPPVGYDSSGRRREHTQSGHRAVV